MRSKVEKTSTFLNKIKFNTIYVITVISAQWRDIFITYYTADQEFPVILTFVRFRQIAIQMLDSITWNCWKNTVLKRRRICRDVWPTTRLKARWTVYSLGSYVQSWSEDAWTTVVCAHCHFSHRYQNIKYL